MPYPRLILHSQKISVSWCPKGDISLKKKKKKRYPILSASYFFFLKNPLLPSENCTWNQKKNQLLKSNWRQTPLLNLSACNISELKPLATLQSLYHTSLIMSGSKAWVVTLCTSIHTHVRIPRLSSTAKKGRNPKDNFVQVSHKQPAESNSLHALRDHFIRHHEIHSAGSTQQRSQEELMNN